jgi:flagellar basal body-associated protein FliL
MGRMIGFVEGADVFLIVALLIFMLVFVTAAIYMFAMSKDQSNQLAHLPFEQDKPDNHEA